MWLSVDGISNALKIGLSKLSSLDTFKDISMGEENIKFVANQNLSGKEDPIVNELDDDRKKWKMKEVILMFLINKCLQCLKRNKNLKSQYFVFSSRSQNLTPREI